MSTPLYQLPGNCRVQGEFVIVKNQDLIHLDAKVRQENETWFFPFGVFFLFFLFFCFFLLLIHVGICIHSVSSPSLVFINS
jgi:hypothetical protein